MVGRIFTLVALGIACLAAGCGSKTGGRVATDGTTRTGFVRREARLPDGAVRKFSVYVPESYDPRRPWPTVVFLQGLGEGGTDGVDQTTVGLGPYIRRNAAKFGLIAVFPQSGGRWTTDDADAIAIACLDDVERRYNVDRSRVYLTGMSTGGYGVWRTGARHVDRFAALAPMCGYDGTEFAARLTKTPVWAFHNSLDPFVFSSSTKATVAKINQLGGKAQVSIYGALGHNCWDRAYGDKDFWSWLLRQRKPKKKKARDS